jgi:hypothetical protein
MSYLIFGVPNNQSERVLIHPNKFENKEYANKTAKMYIFSGKYTRVRVEEI